MDDRTEIIKSIAADPVLAHAVLFKKRHEQITPAFHHKIIKALHSEHRNVLIMAFRGAAKSTLAEEAICIMACLQEFYNGLILGESETRAVERLRAIKHEFEFNDYLISVFGIGPGSLWTETKIVLSNGVMVQAYGRGQSLRGAKHLDKRPDFVFGDDLEDQDSVRTEAARAKTKEWFAGVVLPAITPTGKMRLAATPLDPEALAPELARNKHWHVVTVPAEHIEPKTGERVSAWPERFTLAWLDDMRAQMASIGQADRYVQEYLCQAVDPASRTFTADMFRIDTNLRRSWHAVYAMYDPARTVKATSATTGMVVWSWVSNRLIIWRSGAYRWMPDEIVDSIFKINDEFNPVAIGVEETGLNEFLLQPIRHRQSLARIAVPLRALHAPKGKLDFIRGLQPFFRAGEVIFAEDMPDLRSQLLGFPTGNIDAPNALAYALTMRPGAPVYEGFTGEHVTDLLIARKDTPLWLCINADGRVTTAILVQVHEGRLMVLADWLREGACGEVLPDIVAEASLVSPRPFQLIAPLRHWQAFDNVGLRPTVMRLPADLRKGGDGAAGREELRQYLSRLVRAEPALKIASGATWTARAFAGGFARVISRQGVVGAEPEDTAYKTLLEGLEAFAALLRSNLRQEDDSERNYAYTPQGKRYTSARVL